MDTGQSSQGGDEFEFQMCKTSIDSPADELFYKGKLLPLHLSPRLQMVQNLLQNSISEQESGISPLESCSVSPADSCRVSCELNPDEQHFLQWSTGVTGLTKKPWSKKIKQSVLSQKLKSSREYMKSFFIRPVCTTTTEASYDKKVVELEMDDEISFTCHRLSFSGTMKRNSTSNSNKHSSSSSITTTSTASSNCSCSSSSFSLKSTNGFYEIDFLNKGVNSNSEGEYSIESAIAYCKKSQQTQEKTSK